MANINLINAACTIIIIINAFVTTYGIRPEYTQEELEYTAEKFEPIASEVDVLNYVPEKILEELNIDFNYFAECPLLPKCACTPSGDRVNCAGKGLENLPDLNKLPENVRVLNLSNNRISKILDVSWKPLSNLKVLDLSYNLLSNLQSNTFDNLTSLEELNLSHNLFQNWTDLNPNKSLQSTSNLKYLDLSFNKFKTLANLETVELFFSESLEVFNLEGCSIVSVAGRNSVLNGLPSIKIFILRNNPLGRIHDLRSLKLHTLDLSYCQLTYVHSASLLGLPSLTNLVISHNYRLIISTNIGTLQSDSLNFIDISFCNLPHVSLSGFPNLKKALLSGNMIRILQIYEFMNNSKLEHLDLSSNSISSLNSNVFRGLVSLKFLNLSYNTISKVPDDVFINTPNLMKLVLSRNYIKQVGHIISSSITTLDLSMCEIEKVDVNSLEQLTSLLDLNLSKNLISYLPDGISSDTLKYLDLSFNRLSKISNQTFSYLPRIIYLDLSSNRFSTVFSKFYFHNNPYLGRLVLSDNTWRCECSDFIMYEFYEYLVLETNMREDPQELTCHSPSKVYGLTWQEACLAHWFPDNETFDGSRALTATVVILLCFFGCIFLMVTIKRLMKAKLEALNREREQQMEEARERLRLLRLRHEQEAQCNAPDPRDLISPPSYAEALLLPRLEGSSISLTDVGDRKKKRKKTKKSKSSNDIVSSLNQNGNVVVEISSDESPEEDKEIRRKRRRSRKIGSNEIRQLENSPYARRRASNIERHTVQIESHLETSAGAPSRLNAKTLSGNEASVDESDV